MGLNMSSIFPTGREATVIYNWVDIASATGYVLYYGIQVIETSGTTYKLFLQDMLSPLINSTVIKFKAGTYIAGVGYEKGLDLDFDLSAAQLNQTLRGTAYVRLEYSTDVTNSANAYWVVKIRKWNGATETEIASGQTATKTAPNGITTYSDLLPITIPKTTIKQGENLRITVEFWGQGAGVPTDAIIGTLKFDPDDAGDNSSFVCAIPYKIEV